MPRTRTLLIPAEQAIAYLQALSTEMHKLGWAAQLKTETGRVPCLYVQNPAPGAAALNEHIYAAPKAGDMWLWWSWAEPIARDPAGAAAIISRALRATVPEHLPAPGS